MLTHMRLLLNPHEQLQPLAAAPPREMLNIMGGSLSIEAFRNAAQAVPPHFAENASSISSTSTSSAAATAKADNGLVLQRSKKVKSGGVDSLMRLQRK